MKKQLVIFDMDGLMFDTERIYQRAYQVAFQGHHITFSTQNYVDYAGKSEESNRQSTQERAGSESLGQIIYDEALEEVNRIYREEDIPIKKGLIPLLSHLSDQGIEMAVASSSDRPTIDFLLEKTQLTDFFSAIVSGDSVQASKPEPDIFLKAMKECGQERQGCLILEDSIAGVQAAHRAGIEVIMVPDLIAPTASEQQLALAIVDDLSQVIPYFS